MAFGSVSESRTLFKVSQQTIWQLLGKGVTAFSTFITLGFIARTYGEDGTGVFTLSLAYLAFFYLAVDLGLNAYLLPQMAQWAETANKLFNLRLVWSVLLVVLANLLSFLLPYQSLNFHLFVLIGSLTIISSGIVASAGAIFQSRLKYESAIIASSLSSAASLVVILALSFFKTPLPFLALGPLAGGLVAALVGLSLAKDLYRFSLQRPALDYFLEVLKKAWPVSLTLILNTVYFRLDTFILSALYPISTVGIYNLAYQIFQTALVVPTFLMNSYYPLMLGYLRQSQEMLAGKTKGAMLLMLGLGGLATVATWVLAPFFTGLISGGGFTGAADSLRVLSLGFPAFFPSALLMMALIALGKYKTLAVIYGAGLVVNAALNLIWIPQFSYLAASWVTVVSEYLILALQLFILGPWLYKTDFEDDQKVSP